MKTTAFTRTALLGGLAVAGLGAGAATLAYADPTPAPTPSATSTAAPGGQEQGQGGRGGPGGKHGRGDQDGQLAKDLAAKLGLDEAKVSDALKAVHDEERAARQSGSTPSAQPTPGTRPDPAQREADLAAKLATKLGVDQARVTTALTELRDARQADAKKAFAGRLDTAVTDGKLTRAEADAVQKAADAGVIGMGGRR